MPPEGTTVHYRNRLCALLAAAALVMLGCGPEDGSPASPNHPSGGANGTGSGAAASSASPLPQALLGKPHALAANLEVPWGVGFLPGGDALVTERDSTKLLRVTPEGDITTVATIEAAQPSGEGGLLGLAVSPGFSGDHWIYLYYTTARDNRIVRFQYTGGGLSHKQVLLDGIPSASIHNGGRLTFGPDGMLYASTGEAGQGSRAQNLDSLGGKILRMTPQGEPAPGNPFDDSVVYSYGHRNVEGLAFGSHERLYATEFGASAHDEINLIQKAHNYGWPRMEGYEGNAPDDKFTAPLLTWSPPDASPSGLAIAGGSLWIGALRGERLWRVPLLEDGSLGRPKALFEGKYGRLRTAVRAPSGSLWVTTSNRDGRGSPRPKDDKILVIPLKSG